MSRREGEKNSCSMEFPGGKRREAAFTVQKFKSRQNMLAVCRSRYFVLPGCLASSMFFLKHKILHLVEILLVLSTFRFMV